MHVTRTTSVCKVLVLGVCNTYSYGSSRNRQESGRRTDF